MRIAYFDCFSGISGDMILGALVDMGLDIDYLRKEFKKLSISGYDVMAKKVEKNHIYGTKVDIIVKDKQTHRNLRDINKIIENLIFNHLVFCDYSVYVGKLGTKEIDFVAEKENERMYVQVAYQLSDTETIQREFGNLDLISDHYPKYVVSMDPLPINTSYNGIKHIHLREFLSQCF